MLGAAEPVFFFAQTTISASTASPDSSSSNPEPIQTSPRLDVIPGNVSMVVPVPGAPGTAPATPVPTSGAQELPLTGMSMRDIAVAAGASGGGAILASVAAWYVLRLRTRGKVWTFMCSHIQMAGLRSEIDSMLRRNVLSFRKKGALDSGIWPGGSG
jgi:hypothetical protein